MQVGQKVSEWRLNQETGESPGFHEALRRAARGEGHFVVRRARSIARPYQPSDVGGEALVVSQFTLYADTRKGRRPSFTDAALPEIADPLVKRFAQLLSELGIPTQTGRFGAHMLVEIENDGPVTIWLER